MDQCARKIKPQAVKRRVANFGKTATKRFKGRRFCFWSCWSTSSSLSELMCKSSRYSAFSLSWATCSLNGRTFLIHFLLQNSQSVRQRTCFRYSYLFMILLSYGKKSIANPVTCTFEAKKFRSTIYRVFRIASRVVDLILNS